MGSNKVVDKRKSVAEAKSIHAYWYNEAVTNTEEFIGKFGESCLENVVQDDGDSCYACGKFDKHLMRCHMTPKALGGSHENSNLFLMCRDCHAENPDTIYLDLFQKYVKNRRPYSTKLFQDIQHNLNYLMEDATPDELTAWKNSISCSVQELKDKMLCTSLEVATVSLDNKMSVATMVGCLWKNLTRKEPVGAVTALP